MLSKAKYRILDKVEFKRFEGSVLSFEGIVTNYYTRMEQQLRVPIRLYVLTYIDESILATQHVREDHVIKRIYRLTKEEALTHEDNWVRMAVGKRATER